MNAVEIEEAVSQLSVAPFEPENFPYAFLEAFGNKATEIQRLKSGNSNKTDIEGAILQRSNIHLTVCPTGEVTKTGMRWLSYCFNLINYFTYQKCVRLCESM